MRCLRQFPEHVTFSVTTSRPGTPSHPNQPLNTRPRVNPKGNGGGERVRTDDPLLAKQVLSQLSYTPAQGSVVSDQPSEQGMPIF